MIDDLERLAGSGPLQRLLSHYADCAGDDRERWHDRVSDLEGIDVRDLVKLHGELIAFSWVDLNVGGRSCCYRITTSGLRALRSLERSVEEVGEESGAIAPAADENTAPSEPVLAFPLQPASPESADQVA